MTSKTTATDERFTFDHDGKTYTFERSLDVVRKPGWLRKNRRRDELDLAFTILEEVAGDEALAAIDEMEEDEFVVLMERLNESVTATFQ